MLRIIKRGKYYHVQGTVSYAGSSVKVRQTTGETQKGKAADVCRIIEQRILTDLQGKVSLMPLDEAANLWFVNKSETDWYNIKALVGFFNTTPLASIGTNEWNKFKKARLGGCKPSHINRIRATLVAIANHASVPIAIPKEQEENDRIRFLTLEQQNQLLRSYPPHARPLFTAIAYQGLRKSEAMFLKWQHVNFDFDTILIEETKNGKRRIVPIHPRTKQAILSKQRYEQFKAFSKRKNKFEHDYCFPSTTGKVYASGDSINKLHIRACKKAGITDFTIHDWRHHWASHLAMKGASIPTLMKLGGWATESMVLRYADVSNDHIRDTLMRLE